MENSQKDDPRRIFTLRRKVQMNLRSAQRREERVADETEAGPEEPSKKEAGLSRRAFLEMAKGKHLMLTGAGAKMTVRGLSDIERGQMDSTRLLQLAWLARVLGVSVIELLCDTADPGNRLAEGDSFRELGCGTNRDVIELFCGKEADIWRSAEESIRQKQEELDKQKQWAKSLTERRNIVLSRIQRATNGFREQVGKIVYEASSA